MRLGEEERGESEKGERFNGLITVFDEKSHNKVQQGDGRGVGGLDFVIPETGVPTIRQWNL